MSNYTAGSKSVVRSEAEFQRLSQTIATSIQKILQNGMYSIHPLAIFYSNNSNKIWIVILVSTMQRMVSQIGTPQDSPDHKQQL